MPSDGQTPKKTTRASLGDLRELSKHQERASDAAQPAASPKANASAAPGTPATDSAAPKAKPPALPLRIDFPENLPVSARRQEIERAMREHQVLIVSGETGSGKTTQLPKIALALGRGLGRNHKDAQSGKRGQWIGHTQPRRIAASSVAKRIAEELQTPMGEVVGYKVRFNDRLGPDARVKLMTDGILLAETQTDPLLKAYDTLIIDEAHERSLNIDFLLGYLKQILPRRPDLKVIITSATIDAERFAQHFASRRGGQSILAPVIAVSGRTYPVEIRYRPFEETRESDLNTAIASAVDELWQARAGGDILVFLPGEREIREAADHLHKHLAHDPLRRHSIVLPLFARLSQAEQDRVFETGGPPRVVLATNVAETSLTVPGVRYVVDAGTARVKRYSYRSKVEQLLVEPISQAAANQRSGRSGRVADGIAIRLYEEDGFASRPRFTDPEILRSSLAGVILRMKSLGLGAVEDFPFLEAPSQRAITDGYQLLQELGAMDEFNQLTDVGQQMARLPLDPRVGRMLLEAKARGALQEVLVVAAALSVQDVRDRPLDKQAQADQQHARFDDDKSEFVSYLKLWQWLHDARGGKTGGLPSAKQQSMAAAQAKKAGRNHAALPVAQRSSGAVPDIAPPAPVKNSPAIVQEGGDQATHKLSNRQYEQLLKSSYINVRRVREWRDIHQQLTAAVTEQGWRVQEQKAAASYEALHLSLLAGLLGNVGYKQEDNDWYLGARGIKFYRHPGAHLRKKPGRWVVAAELVETTRLFGREMANIEPQWLEEVGGHLLKKQLLDPHWEQKAGEAIALERATLYGLVVYSGRKIPFERLDPVAAREIMIRQALVQGDYTEDWERKFPFLVTNRKRIAKVEELEHKSRRQDVLVDEELIYAFYDQWIPEAVANGRQLEHWYRQERKLQPQLLELQKDALMRHEAAGITSQAFPPTIKMAGMDLNATYLHEPGNPRDGVTVTIPLYALNQVQDERADWLVPGMLKAKLQALIKSLPQRPRSRLLPLAETAETIYQEWLAEPPFGQGDLGEKLRHWVRNKTGLEIKPTDFKADMLSPHLFMNFRVVDEHGRQLGQGRNLAALKAQWGQQARGAFQALAGLKLAGASEAPEATPAAPEPNTEKATNAKAAAPASTATKPGNGKPQSESNQAMGEPEQRHTEWDFGELPEIMEWGRGSRKLVGFPALVDQGDAVTIEVFDEPEAASKVHRKGLTRLFALHIKDALKYLEKSIPDMQKMSMAYMPLGSLEDLREQIIQTALQLAFLQEPLPINAEQFAQRVQDGRPRLSLLAQEVARLAGQILAEYSLVVRKLKDTKGADGAVADIRQQLERLVGKRFVQETPQAALKHLPRYLKGMLMRLDKYREDPARDQSRQNELAPLESRYWKKLAERRGQTDDTLQDYRWLLEELRVSFFAQQLRTPQPVSVKRLEKVWSQVVA